MTWKSKHSCGVYALSELLQEDFESVYREIVPVDRELVRVGGEPVGIIASEISWHLFRKNIFNHVWHNPKEFIGLEGSLSGPSETDVYQWAHNDKGMIAGLQLRSRGYEVGHWVAIQDGMYKWSPSEPWKPMDKLDSLECYLHSAVIVGRP